MLPCSANALPIVDSFLALSFEDIEKSFKSQRIAKFVYVFMAQCVCTKVPPFFLGCISTNNFFTATEVLKRWKHIYSECQKRSITVISFGGDGDSRILRAMKVSYQFKINANDKQQLDLSPSSLLKELANTKQWPWFWLQRIGPVIYVQDHVHVAVKLKARFLKPSIILPFGDVLAGSHHLKMVSNTFTKDHHGIRHRDLEHKDKQNFESVSQITAQCVLDLLDAKGTLHYLKSLQYFVDAYLNKILSPLEWIFKAWYVIFFFRFWHGWLLKDKKHTIKNNFITYNYHACIELNGHSLILLLLTLRDTIPNGDQHFLPWLLGSQACEQTFRTARSMTSTFSTIINFSMLGFLHQGCKSNCS